MKKLFILVFLLLPILAWSVDVIIKDSNNNVTHYMLDDVYLSTNQEAITIQADSYIINMPISYVEEIQSFINQAQEFFDTTEASPNYTIQRVDEFNGIRVNLIVRTTSQRIEIFLQNFNVYIYWNKISDTINNLLKE